MKGTVRHRLARAPLVGRLVRRTERRRRSRRPVDEAWSASLAGEIRFWDERLQQLPEPLRDRCDPTAPLQEEVAELIEAAPGSTVRLLDCGAGPLTFLGKTHPGYVLEITAVDALADQYNASLQRAGIVPVVRTQRCETERLSELFDADCFDVACARNTLDHSYDPVRAIREMIRCVKPGAAVLLQHARNVAEKESYLGMHQWNFSVESNDVTVWRPGQRTELAAAVADVAHIERAWTTQTATAGHPLEHVVLRKRRPSVC